MSEARNVWQRINAVKRGLRGVSLKKSGKNSFSKYEYMELNDFENALEDFCDKEGINTMFFWYTDKAVLRVTNIEDPKDFVEICSPVVDCGIKGASPIQNLGGMQTYLRRYLFVSTFGIAEHDLVEQQSPKDKRQGEWKQEVPQTPATSVEAPKPSPNSLKAYMSLLQYLGYDGDKGSEKSTKALADSKDWMVKNFGQVVAPTLFTEEQVGKVNALMAPENFQSDPL